MNRIRKRNFLFSVCFVFYSHFVFASISGEDIFSEKENLKNKTTTWAKNIPVKFIENKGQMVDMNNQPVPFVLFKAEAPGINIYITEKGLTYLFFETIELEDEEERENKGHKKSSLEKTETKWHRTDVIIKNATIKKENIIKEGESKNFFQYFLAHCPNGITDVHSFEKITIKEIYPGIDWVLYNSTGQGFKYDFIIHPNADPAQIKLIYEGAGKFVSEKNQICFKNKIGEMIEGKLFCYQGNEKREIASEYFYKKVRRQMSDDRRELPGFIIPTSNIQHLSSDIFSYEAQIQLNDYDHSKELIIDPQITWATFYGANDLDGAYSIDCDDFGNVFTTGYIKSTNFPVTNPGGTTYFQGVIGGSTDFFIMKFDKNGTLIWSTYYGGTLQDVANYIHVDVNNNVYLTGHTFSTNFPVQNMAGAFNQATFFGTVTVFILKFNTAGTRLWSTYYGLDNEQAFSIASDNTANIFIVGETYSSAFPTFNPGAGAYFDGTYSTGGYDAFILKFDAAGVRRWATYYGGTAGDQAYAVATDPSGNVYVSGATASANFPTMNGGGFFQAGYGGNLLPWGGDVFILKFSNTGVRQWATFYGGSDDEISISLATDNNGNVFVSGNTASANFPTFNPGNGAYYQAAFGGIQDEFILKFNATTNRDWATYYGGSGRDNNASYDDLITDKCGNVYLSFYTESANIATKASCDNGYFDNSFNGLSDQFICKFSNTGIPLWATYIAGNDVDIREALAMDNDGNLYITGEWTDAQGAPTIDPTTYPMINSAGAYFDNTFNGGMDDSFIAKFEAPKIIASANTQTSGCATNITASATGGCSPYQYNWYNSSWSQIGSTQTINNAAAGTYYVIITDSLSCSLDTASVVVNAGGANVFVTQTPNICSGQNYTLPDGSITSVAGTYLDTLTAVNGCDSIITTILTIINSFTVSQNATICNGQSYSLPGGGTATTAGTYNDTLTSIFGCDSIINTTLNVVQFLTSSQSPIICAGNIFTLPGGNIVTAAGTYYDTLTTTSGCDSVITTTLTVTPANTFSQTINICTGQNYILPGGTSVSAAGSYIDTINTLAGCDSIIATQLNIVATITTTQSASLCNGNTYTLPGGTIVNSAGNYMDTLTSQGGCDSIITTTITIKPNSTSTHSHTMCSGETYILPSGTAVTISGTYTDTLTAANGCDSTITTTINVNPIPIVNITGNTTIITGQSTTLTVTGGGNYNWTPSTGLDNTTNNIVNANPTQTTTYCVEVTSSNGCKDTSCVIVNVELPCPKAENLAVPNAFSPNNDNVNDEFCLQGWDDCVEEFNIVIYSRWGEKVFESNKTDFCWDGIYAGKTCEAAVFVYYIKARFSNIDTLVSKQGNISLIK